MTIILDTETTTSDPKTAELRVLGGLDVETGEIEIFYHNQKEQIKSYLSKHKVWVGFNIKSFDKPVLERYGIEPKFKVIFDLYESLAPRGDNGFGEFNKDRLRDINPELNLKNYKLKTIVETLGLDEQGTKGTIDYSIFQKEEWEDSEKKEIEKYLKQDLIITKKLFDWYVGIFKPLEQYLPKKDVEKFKHLSCSSGCLSYKVICNLLNLPEEYNDQSTAQKLRKESGRVEGGHHIHARWEKVRGNIVCKDFVSHYPTIMIMYNLLSKDKLEIVQKILTERISAKKSGDKSKALALKVPINSIYGILNNPSFKNIYNSQSASEVTRIGRELLKKYAKTLDVGGFVPLYGFTDSVYCLIPKELSEDDLELTTKYFIETEKKNSPNPIDSFGLGVDGKYKFVWFIEKKDNNYLSVTIADKIKVKGALFDVNTPKVVIKLFETYISPKIVKELDVNFTESELLKELKQLLEKNPELSAEDYSVKDVSSYKSTTSLQYQISSRYGVGTHSLIPNTAGVGVGRSDEIKYCSLEDFKEHNLDFNSIHIERMMRYLKPFYTTKEEVLEL